MIGKSGEGEEIRCDREIIQRNQTAQNLIECPADTLQR